MVALGSDLHSDAYDAIIEVLRNNEEAFAWGPKDLPGVARATIEYRLALRSDAAPKKQKLWRMSVDRLQAAKKEILKLLKGGSSAKSSTPNG